jgi:ATP-binding cassette, subfamily B, bacterial PglK
VKFRKSILQPLGRLLNPNDKANGIWIVSLMVLNAVLDLFSLASFLPLILLLVNPGSIFSNKYFSSLYSTFKFTSPAMFIVALTACALIFVIFKSVVALWIARSKANYCFGLGSDVSSRVLSKYLEISYIKFTQSDLTKELSRIANLPISFANNIIMPLANLLSEGLVLLILLVCIVFYDPKVFALLVLVLFPIALIYFLKRNSLAQTSDELKVKYPRSLKYALQVVEGWVDIKAFGKDSFFKNRFTDISRDLAKTFSRDHTNQTGASRQTEIIAALIICSLIVYAVIGNKNYQQTFLLLGVYAGASFRMIPSLNRILNAVLQIKSHRYLFAELEGIINFQPEKNHAIASPLQFVKTIEMKNVSFQYPGGPTILHRASLTIHKGDKIALVGKSGSGKTTIMMILLQFLKENSGEILLDGEKVNDIYRNEWRKIFSYVPQSPYILDGTIVENIALGYSKTEIDHEKIRKLIQDLDLQEMIHQLPDGFSTQVGEKGVRLSGGQRQRIAIARSLYAEAEVLLFDEITNQLDTHTEVEILNTLKRVTQQKKTIFMITHHDHLLNAFDRILTLENGRVIEKVHAALSH